MKIFYYLSLDIKFHSIVTSYTKKKKKLKNKNGKWSNSLL